MSKKYQVFISSTYTDLVDERKAVEETIIRSGDIPVGMEAFPAADDEQFEFIKTVIDSCDYYVLIVAGRYGSQSEDGMSYTEKEFRYAVEKGLPVLFFPHANPGSLSANKSESTDEGKAKLSAFVDLASTKRIRKTWSNLDALKLAVRESLDFAKATKPRPGWVRGGAANDADLLREINDLRKQNAALTAAAPSNAIDLGFDISGLDTAFEVSGTCKQETPDEFGGTYGKETHWYGKVMLQDIFSYVAPSMRDFTSNQVVNHRMALACQRRKESAIYASSSYYLDTSVFDKIVLQLEALGLIEVSTVKSGKGINEASTRLTPKGRHVMFQLVVMPAES